MHFTATFHFPYSVPESYTLAFVPSPCWMRTQEIHINLNPETPEYRQGSVRKLLSTMGLSEDAPAGVTVLVHPNGNGTEKDLQALLDDFASEDIPAQCINLSYSINEHN